MRDKTARRQVLDLELRVERLEQKLADELAVRGIELEQLGELKSQLMQLSGQLADLERPVRELETEWIDTFEKFRNLYGRLVKRAQRDAKREEPANEAPPNPAALRILGGQRELLRGG